MFVVFFVNHFLSSAFASALVEECRPSERIEMKGSSSLSKRSPSTKRKSKTLPSDPLSLLVPNTSLKGSKYATIGTSSLLKEDSRSKSPSFVMPSKILSEDVLSLLEGKKVTIAGRRASLVRIEHSQEEIERSQQLLDEIKKNNLQYAILTKSLQAGGHENIKKSILKTPSGKYSLYDTLQVIMSDVTLIIKFSKINKEEKKVKE